jgi:hypothetical protein
MSEESAFGPTRIYTLEAGYYLRLSIHSFHFNDILRSRRSTICTGQSTIPTGTNGLPYSNYGVYALDASLTAFQDLALAFVFFSLGA